MVSDRLIPFKEPQFLSSTAASAVVEKDIVYFAAGYGVGSTAIKVSKKIYKSKP